MWLKTTHLVSERLCKKLADKKIRPFRVKHWIGLQVYRLKLPETMWIHLVFHVSLLEPYTVNKLLGRIQEPPPPIGEIRTDGEDTREWEVEKIVKSWRQWGHLQYLVKWKGYTGPESLTWQTPQEVENCPDLIWQFHAEHPLLPGHWDSEQLQEPVAHKKVSCFAVLGRFTVLS